MIHSKVNRIVAAIVFLIALGMYFKTMSPSVPFWDCGEFIATSYIMGVPHPPGAPLFVLIGRLFGLLPIGGEIAWRVNLISVLCSALCVLFMYLISVRLLLLWRVRQRRMFASDAEGRWDLLPVYAGSAIGALCIAFSDTFWFNATEAEVYGIAMLIAVFGIWLAFLWTDRHENPDSDRILLLIAYMFGLGAGVHLQCLLTIPSILLLVWFTNRRPLKDPWLWVGIVLLFMLGYSTYLSLYIRSGLNPAIDENNPENLRNFLQFLQRKQYGEETLLSKLFERKSPFWSFQVGHMFVKYFMQQFPLPFRSFLLTFRKVTGPEYTQVPVPVIPLLLGLFGMYVHLRREWRGFAIMLIVFGLMGVGLVVYLNMEDPQPRERDYFFVGAFVIFAMWIGMAVSWMLEHVRRAMPTPMVPCALALFFLLIPLGMVAAGYHAHDRTGNYIAYDYAYNILNSCDEDAILFTNGDNDTFPLWFLQEVEKIRKDVKVVNLSLLNTNWYIKQLRDFEPKIHIQYSDQYIDEVLCGADIEDIIRSGRVDGVDRSSGRVLPWAAKEVLAAGLRWTMTPAKGYSLLRVQDVMVYNIINWNRWERPVYFAVTVAGDNKIGLDDHLSMEGMVFRLGQEKGVIMDPERSRHHLWNVYRYRGVRDPEVHKDANTTKLLSNYRAAFSQLIHTYWTQGKADEVYETMVKYDQTLALAWDEHWRSAQILERLGKGEEAAEFVEKAITASDWSDPNRMLAFASLLIDINALDRADSLCREIIERYPSLDKAHYGLGAVMEKRGEYEAAIRALEEGLKFNPADQDAQRSLTALQQKLEQAEIDTGIR